MLKTMFFAVLICIASLALGGDDWKVQMQQTYENEQFFRRKHRTLLHEDLERWTPEMHSRFNSENPGFKEAEQNTTNEPPGHLDVIGPQLTDYTSKNDATGAFFYILGIWIVWPLVSLLLMVNTGTKPLGILLFIVWVFVAASRWIEGVALFVVLPFMLIVGVVKSIFK